MFPLRDVNPTRITPVITVALILGSLYVFFFVQQSSSDPQGFLYERAAISCEITTGNPLSVEEISGGQCDEGGAPFFPEKSPLLAILTSMFLHGSVGHVLSNMWFLWIFGNNVEEAFGFVRYLAMYVLAGIAATLTFVVMNPDSTVPLVGASGAIAGVLGAYAVLFPTHRVESLVGFWIVPVPAAIFLGIWFFLQFNVGVSNVAWEAHVGGFVFGFLVALVLRRSLLRRVAV